MATPSDIASAALTEVDRLRETLRKKRTVQVYSKDERDLVKATAITWFNTHRKAFPREMPEAKSADGVYRKLLAASDRGTSRAVYVARLKELRPLLITLRDAVVGAPSPVDGSDTPPDFSPLA